MKKVKISKVCCAVFTGLIALKTQAEVIPVKVEPLDLTHTIETRLKAADILIEAITSFGEVTKESFTTLSDLEKTYQNCEDSACRKNRMRAGSEAAKKYSRATTELEHGLRSVSENQLETIITSINQKKEGMITTFEQNRSALLESVEEFAQLFENLNITSEEQVYQKLNNEQIAALEKTILSLTHDLWLLDNDVTKIELLNTASSNYSSFQQSYLDKASELSVDGLNYAQLAEKYAVTADNVEFQTLLASDADAFTEVDEAISSSSILNISFVPDISVPSIDIATRTSPPLPKDRRTLSFFFDGQGADLLSRIKNKSFSDSKPENQTGGNDAN